MGSHIFMGLYIGAIRCTVHDILISSVMYLNRLYVKDGKNPCPIHGSFKKGMKFDVPRIVMLCKGGMDDLKLLHKMLLII